MKIRMGFVSNSSSGSFIIHWRMKAFGKRVTKERAIGNLFGVCFKDNTATEGSLLANTEGEIDWEGTWNQDARSKVEDAMNKTVQNDDGSFTTTFWTSMVNSAEDFGETAKSMAIGLMADGMFEVIDTKQESDY